MTAPLQYWDGSQWVTIRVEPSGWTVQYDYPAEPNLGIDRGTLNPVVPARLFWPTVTMATPPLEIQDAQDLAAAFEARPLRISGTLVPAAEWTVTSQTIEVIQDAEYPTDAAVRVTWMVDAEEEAS
jgi:hypothetical protein